MASTRKSRTSLQRRELYSSLGIAFRPAWPDRFGTAIRATCRSGLFDPIRTLSLFTGAGGLDIGFHEAGFNSVAMVEIEPQFSQTLEANCGKTNFFESGRPICVDIREFVRQRSEQMLGEIDFIIGGPPCQTFSAAGRRAGGVQGTDDPRGLLFESYVELLVRLNPRGFVFENVYGITGARGGEDWEQILGAFRSAGYQVHHRVLDAADYGVPQHRERLFIVGTKEKDFCFPAPTHGPDSAAKRPYFGAGDAVTESPLTDADRSSTVNGRYGNLLLEVPPGLNYSYFTSRMGHPKPVFAWRSKFSDFLYKADPESPVRTLKAQGGQYTGPFHWDSRPFSVAELKRLQTFPDRYRISGGRSAAIKQIGNSVPPQLARILALSVLSQVFDVRLPFELPLLPPDQTLGFRARKRNRSEEYAIKSNAAIRLRDAQVVDPPIEAIDRYWGAVGKNFSFSRFSKRAGDFRVTAHLLPSILKMGLRPIRPVEDASAFKLEIKPCEQRGWDLPVESIVVRAANLTEQLFMGAWKSLESELARRRFKEDLVQLCGYYQYEPAFRCKLVFAGKVSPSWRTVQKVVAGIGVRQTLPISDWAKLWRVRESAVPCRALMLRSLGFEVRSHKTNPQLPQGTLLIPYCFPTLNPKSVQLHKELF